MEPASEHDVARLLEALRQGDDRALDALFPLVYEELRTIAHRQRQRWNGNDTLDTTALVHEAYLRLVDQSRASWQSRAHFLATAAKAMRQILVNYARDRIAQKRGGTRRVLSLEQLGERLESQMPLADDDADLLLALDAALETLGRTNPRQARIVECRFFGGMSIEETAEALGISTATVSRGWALAQVRLYQDVHRELSS